MNAVAGRFSMTAIGGFRSACAASKQPGTKQKIELLRLGKKDGYTQLQEAVAIALATGCRGVAVVRYLLTAGTSMPPLESGELGGLARYDLQATRPQPHTGFFHSTCYLSLTDAR